MISLTIQQAIIRLAAKRPPGRDHGGTGIAERDVTPEATRAVCSRLLEGVAKRMRFEGSKKTPKAALSRAVCGVRARSLVLNLREAPAARLNPSRRWLICSRMPSSC